MEILSVCTEADSGICDPAEWEGMWFSLKSLHHTVSTALTITDLKHHRETVIDLKQTTLRDEKKKDKNITDFLLNQILSFLTVVFS